MRTSAGAGTDLVLVDPTPAYCPVPIHPFPAHYPTRSEAILRFPLFFAFQAIALMPPVSSGPERRSSLA